METRRNKQKFLIVIPLTPFLKLLKLEETLAAPFGEDWNLAWLPALGLALQP